MVIYNLLITAVTSRFNFATHPYHGVDTSKYYAGIQKPETKE